MSTGGSTLKLKLDISKKCDGQCNCQGGSSIPGLKAKKEAVPNVTNFTKYSHSVPNGKTFRLNKTLVGDGGQIGTGGQPIPNVTDVSVYYWNGDDSKPILLEVITNTGSSGTTTFYGKNGTGGHLSWLNGPVQGKTLKEALDQQNCQNNNAVPFDIQDSQSGSIPRDTKSLCIESKNITQYNLPQNPPGSDYVSKAYIITASLNTRISKVTYGGDDTIGIPPIGDLIDVITLYSYPGSSQVPLILEFKSSNNGTSRWFHSTNLNGTKWLETGGTGFYDDQGITPQPAFSEKLDEVLCSQYGNVTLDLSHTRMSGNYCCSDHKDVEKVSIEKKTVSCIHQSTKYYKHTITDGGFGVGGIYYKDKGGNRNKITLSGVSFPISGINNVYVFYCKGEEPSLIYVDSQSATTKGWYKRDNGHWIWDSRLSGIKRTDIDSGLTCAMWTRLKTVLTECNCSNLSGCSYGSYDEQKNQEENLKLEEQEAIKQREKTLQLPPPTVPPLSPSSNSSDNSTGSGSSSAVSGLEGVKEKEKKEDSSEKQVYGIPGPHRPAGKDGADSGSEARVGPGIGVLGTLLGRFTSRAIKVVSDPNFSQNLMALGETSSDFSSKVGKETLRAALGVVDKALVSHEEGSDGVIVTKKAKGVSERNNEVTVTTDQKSEENSETFKAPKDVHLSGEQPQSPEATQAASLTATSGESPPTLPAPKEPDTEPKRFPRIL